jgi:hypothetical protein
MSAALIAFVATFNKPIFTLIRVSVFLIYFIVATFPAYRKLLRLTL